MDATTVRKGGLEPPRPKAQEPKSCVSANFTTRAGWPRPTPGRTAATYRPPVYPLLIELEVAPQFGDVAGGPDVVLGQFHLALGINHDR